MWFGLHPNKKKGKSGHAFLWLFDTSVHPQPVSVYSQSLAKEKLLHFPFIYKKANLLRIKSLDFTI